ncbi:MAG: NAD(P)/FAD-dependent oxidoreductase [Betaproteobacteria bacterium]|nr:MAG: NAD(P)/FAD-dependent oxidoreductase [Betaproteobacteria bacterium]
MGQPADFDALIVGGGHNGLTCACYLAAAGLKVGVFERHDRVGGAALTEEFHPGFRNSVAAYTVSLLHPKVIRDLSLHQHGLRIVHRPMANFLPLGADDCFRMGRSAEEDRAEVARFSPRDAERLPAYQAMLARVADVLRAMAQETPPNVGGGLREVMPMLRAGNRLRRLDMAGRRDVLDLFAKSAGDLLDAWFEAAPLKACFGFDAIVGNYASPYAPGTAYVLLHHVFGEVNGVRGAWGHAIGGMGAITEAMLREAQRLGVSVFTDAGVERVMVSAGRARGIALSDGREFRARCVISNVNPRLLFLELVEPAFLDPDFLQRIRAYRCASATFRMNVALSELPRFECLPEPGPHLSSGIIMAPSLAYMEKAFADAREAGWSRAPVVEMLVPSTLDASLAPAGQHVASLFCQHFAPRLPDERSWDDERERAADAIIDTVTRHAPNFRRSVIARTALSPLDLERRFGLIGGDIFHGALTLDQLWAARPVLGHGAYRAPIRGLYMCGSGTHPGGGVTGLPGMNAAREILRDWRKLPR